MTKISIQLPNKQIQIGEAFLSKMLGDKTQYKWANDMEMGINNAVVDNCEIYMLGWYSPDFDTYIVHFQVCVLDDDGCQADVLQYIGDTNEFDYNDTEWVIQQSTHDNPTKQFVQMIMEY